MSKVKILREHSRHLPHILSLYGMVAVAIVLFFVFSYSKEIQTAVLAGACAGYFSWGVIHHSLHRDLTLSVIIEYLVFALLGFVIISSLILRM